MGSLRRKTATKPLPGNASLITKKGEQLAQWTDRRGKRKTAPTIIGRDGLPRIVVQSGKWLAKFRDGDGILREVSTGCKDKGAAQAVLAGLERRAELIRSNVITATENAIADHAVAAIADHFDAYRQHRITQGLNHTRIRNTQSRLERLAKECGFHRLIDLSGDTLTRWLAEQLSVGMGAGTRNEYRAEMVAFANWCIRSGRLASNPFNDVPRANAKADPRRKRRALTEAELDRLLHVACFRPLAEYGRETQSVEAETVSKPKRSNWTQKPLTYDGLEAAVTLARERLAGNPGFVSKLEERGRERALVYRTLILTGLRRGELASLTIGSIELDSPTPFAKLAAGDEKNRRGSDIPLRADLTSELRNWIEDRRNDFDGSFAEFNALPLLSVPASLVKVLNRDLAAAGISKTDDRGRVVDVHAMRMTLATMLNKAGIAPRTAQEIMRHSDIRLTMETYTDAKMLDVSEALDSLPSLTRKADRREPVRPTAKDQNALRKFPPLFPPKAGHQGQKESFPVNSGGDLRSRSNGSRPVEKCSKPTEKALSEGVSDRAFEVEAKGLEPSTSALRTQRSPS
jgi:integrase